MSSSLKYFCLRCKWNTHHEVVQSQIEDDDYPAIKSETVRCRGCWTQSLVKTTTFEEEIEGEFGKEIVQRKNVDLFPDRKSDFITARTYQKVDSIIYKTYQKAIELFNQEEMEEYCGVAIRKCVERVCIEQGADGNNLEEKIIELTNKGLMPQKAVETLHQLRYVGNDGAHGDSPTRDELRLGIVILESLLNMIYEMEYWGEIVKKQLFIRTGKSRRY